MGNPARRFFIALPVDDQNSVKSLAGVFNKLNSYGSLLKVVPSDNYHITIKFLGSIEEPADSLVKSFLALNQLNKVEYKIEGIGAFPSADNPSVIWAGLDCDEKPLKEIFDSIEILASEFGVIPENRKFIPHLTLARIKKEKKIPIELKNYIKKEMHLIFASAVFHELVLFESITKKEGPEYKRIAVMNLL